ncbi:MAG: transcriptional regulator MraZ [Alphaproteobacteria bacterium]|nr:MAG: transcriptional regulator MraZ [Alphaproteobacteria bacterium]
MDRFASNTINNVDRKGRVSVPAAFRAVLKHQNVLHALMSVDHPVVEAGGEAMLSFYERRLERLDPFSPEYEAWSFYILGDALELKLDGEGRIQLNDRIREQTGIADRVLFEGRGISFWLWEPGQYEAYRQATRDRVRQMRRQLGSASGAPAAAGNEHA